MSFESPSWLLPASPWHETGSQSKLFVHNEHFVVCAIFQRSCCTKGTTAGCRQGWEDSDLDVPPSCQFSKQSYEDSSNSKAEVHTLHYVHFIISVVVLRDSWQIRQRKQGKIEFSCGREKEREQPNRNE